MEGGLIIKYSYRRFLRVETGKKSRSSTQSSKGNRRSQQTHRGRLHHKSCCAGLRAKRGFRVVASILRFEFGGQTERSSSGRVGSTSGLLMARIRESVPSYERGKRRRAGEEVTRDNRFQSTTVRVQVTFRTLSLIELTQESYDMGSDNNQGQPNQWIPEEILPGFRAFMTQFYWDCFGAASEILRALALGIGLEDENHIVQKTLW